MVSKKEFVEIIERLKNYNDLQNKINSLFNNLIDNEENDFCNAGSICIGHEKIVTNLLKNMFNDKDDTISWWLYECNYGRNFELGNLEVNGKAIDLTTSEKLYDYLVNNMEV